MTDTIRALLEKAEPTAWGNYYDGRLTSHRETKEEVQSYLEHMAAKYPHDAHLRSIGALFTVDTVCAALSASAAVEPVGAELLAWAVQCWRNEVANRPLVNVHRRTLDDTWRQVIRRLGGDPDELLGMLSHDQLCLMRDRLRQAESAQPKEAEKDERIAELEARIEFYACCMNTGGADAMRMQMDELRQQLAEQGARLVAAEKDAARYLWLCSSKIVLAPSLWSGGVGFICDLKAPLGTEMVSKETLDSVIDAAIASTGEKP